jgi:hypothetical protein
MEDTYFPHCLKKGTSGQPILNLKMENILEDNNQNGGFGGQSGPMENILLNGEHLTPMYGSTWNKELPNPVVELGHALLIHPKEALAGPLLGQVDILHQPHTAVSHNILIVGVCVFCTSG